MITLDSSSRTNGTSQDFTTYFPDLRLQKDGIYQVALAKMACWYSWYNISTAKGNNTYRWSSNAGVGWTAQTIPNGSYSVVQLNELIQEQTASQTGIILTANYSTLKCEIDLATNWQIDLQSSESRLHELLGFNSQILTAPASGENNVDISDGFNSVNIHCSIVSGSYLNGKSSDIIFNFSPQSGPGYLLYNEPSNMIFLPIVSQGLNSIRLQITDQSNNVLDLNGEDISATLWIKQVA